MDFQERGEEELRLTQGQDAFGTPVNSEIAVAAGPNVVILPPGSTIESLEVDGRDLVILLSDGSRIVVPDGAVFVPQIEVGGVVVPPLNIAQLLTGNEPEPAAGAVRSSGGNFAADEGAIQAAFDLGDLLPFTTFGFPEPREEEVIPDFVDRDPDVVIETPDNPTGVTSAIATVDEEGLPARGEPSEPEGTNAAGNGEIAEGTIVFRAPDGLSAVLINGVEITQVGQSFTSPYGTLTITSINLASGEIGFRYTLQDNAIGADRDGFFAVTVIDEDGDQANATLSILIVDDGPIAADDIGIVPAGSHAPITGNVLANDVSGADDYDADGAVTQFGNGDATVEPGESLQGDYGVLTLNADGSYTYVRNFNTPGGVEDSFTYTIVDQDGTASTATLVIEIGDADNTITFVPETGEGTAVDEGGLGTRDEEPAGTGEIADNDPDNDSDTSETTGSTITFNSVDGVASFSINGVAIDPANLPQTIIQNGVGTFIVTGYTYDPVTGDGTITYDFELDDNTSGDDTSFDFEIEVVDLDGDIATDTLTIDVIDDEPLAVDDSGTQQSEDGPIVVDVFANDTPGADDVDFDAIAVVEGSIRGEGTVTYNGDGTFSYVPGPGEEGTVTFDYSITDGDGDVATATVTLTLLEDSVPEIAVEGDSDVEEAGLPARGEEPAGSDESSSSETATGSIAVATGNDTVASLVINGVDVTAGGTVITAKGELTITLTNSSYSYSYTLTDNTLTDPDSDSFAVVMTDSDGDTANTVLVIAIIDDAPAAEDDANAIAAGEYGPVAGNVLANDVEGADGAQVTSYSGAGGSGLANDIIQGAYGTLTIAADGSYSYTRDPGTPGGVTDSFDYTITDGDGDSATATLVITIANSGTTLDLPTAGEDGTSVEESGLAGPPAGSQAPSDDEFTSGTFSYSAPDGPASVTIGGIAVTFVGQTFVGTHGTLTIDAISAGSISYSYELTSSTIGDDTQDEFVVRVTDQDGDFSEDTLEITIVDDIPTSTADFDSVTEDGPIVADGNLLLGSGGGDANATDGVADVAGADGATVTGVAVGVVAGPVAGAVASAVAGSYGELTVAADGSYSYELNNDNPLVQGLDGNGTLSDVFTYTITDGDGDTSTTTVTITINGKDDPVVINGLDGQGAEETLYEDDLSDGSSPDAGQLTQTGSFTVTSQDGLASLTVGGTVVFEAAVSITYPVTIADPVYGLLTITGVATTTDADGDVVAATISYSYVLDDNSLLHTGANDGLFTDSFIVEATDSDGSLDTASLDITIVDDVPTATDDSAGQVTENQPIVIDVFVNDIFGADGVDTGDAAKVFVSTGASQGTVTYDPATGQFTYTPAPGAGSDGDLSDFFEYTIIDRDGDSSVARVDITLQPDSEPSGGERVATVDDDGLAENNPLSTDGDLDANLDDDPGDSSEASFTGTLSFDVGNDTPASITFDPALDGQIAAIGQETVTYSVNGNILTATVTGGSRDGTELFTVEITDPTSGSYVVTLLDNVVHAVGDAENDALASINFIVEDSDGDTTTTNLGIVFDDDAPTATDNSNSATEGGSIGGNVLIDDDGAGIDASGADGYGPDGAIVDIASVNGGTSNSTVNGEGKLVLAGQYGTLTLDVATGVYSYQSDANSTNSDAQDVFTYTIVDGDGDEVTATLTINVDNVVGQVSDNDVLVDEAGLANGSDPASDSETDADGQITVTGASGTLVYTLLSPADGTYGTLTLDNSTGAYSYTLDTPYTDGVNENGANVVNGAESFAYEVRDTLGNLIGTGTISVSIIDDIPTATDQAGVAVAEDAVGTIGGNVMLDGIADTEGADGAAVTAITVDGMTTSVPQNGDAVSVITSKGTYTIDMDGNWTFDPNSNLDHSGGDISADFSYTLTDGDGDFDTATQPITIIDGKDPVAGPDIALALDDQNLADGSTPGAPDFQSDTIVFTAGSDDIASIVFGDTASLGGGLTWERVSDTQITGSDGGRLVVTLELSVTGTTATVTATLNDNYDDHPDIDVDDLADLGTVEVIATDIDNDSAIATVSLSVSDDLPTVSASEPVADALTVDESDLATDASADFSGLFTPDYNADNPGTLGDFILGINAGPTGLVDTATGEAVILQMNGNVVEGVTQATGELVFTVSVDANGIVTLDQLRAVRHAEPTSDNEPVGLAAASLITLSATVTDSDGDTDTATADIAGGITFLDDGPALTDVAAGATVDVDETDGLPASATSAGPVITHTADFGADGDSGTAFTIDVLNGDSGLATAVGDFPITLVQTNPTTITGTYDDGGGIKTAFTVVINADGTVELTQYVALEHLVDGDDTLGEHNDQLDLGGKISATVTITDGDDDTASATVPIGAGLVFFDDGPSVTLTGSNPVLQVSDADLGGDASQSYAGAFSFDGGTDGTAGTDFALSVTNGAASGIFDTATGNQAFLFLESGVVVGREGADAVSAATGEKVFTLTVDTNGTVELDQLRAVDHMLSNLDGVNATLLADDLVQLIATVTDNDGDTDSATLDIGSDLLFGDDIPNAEPTEPALLDDDAISGNPGGPDDQSPDTDNLAGTLVDPVEGFGNDGGSVAFDMASALPLGFRLVDDPASDGVLIQQEQGTGNWVTVVTVSLNGATGSYSISQQAPIQHADDAANEENEVSFTLDAVLTDGDGDETFTNLTITVDDDTPTAADDGEIATVDDNASAVLVGTVAGLTGNDSYGADGAGTPAITIATGSLGGTVSIVAGELFYTSATDITSPFSDEVESFTYTITDGDGDTVTATFEIRLTDEGPSIAADAATITVDEEGLGGIAGNGDDDGDVAGEAVVQTGVLASLDFGVDGPGDIELAAVADTGLVTLAGNAVETEWDSLTDTLTGKDAVTGDTVFTLEITDVATGAYRFELVSPVRHAGIDTEDDSSFTVGVIVTDLEGEFANGTISITIDDDSPVAAADTDNIGEDDLTTDGNVVDGTNTTSGALGIDRPGADGFGDPIVTSVSHALAGTSDDTTDGSGNYTVAGTYGTLLLNADGTYTYSITNPAVQGLDDGEVFTETFSYTVQDGDGDTSTTSLIITIDGANDAPEANEDTNWTIEDAGIPITGNVLENQDHPGAPSGSFADVADTDIDGEALSVSTTGVFAGTYGELTLNADGTYSYRLYTSVENSSAYDAVQALNEGDPPLTDTFAYTATDGTDSDASTLTISIFGSNDAPSIVGSVTVVSEEGLPGGIADNIGSPTDETDEFTTSGQIVITDVDNATFAVTLGAPTTPGLTSSGLPVTWDLAVDGKTLVGSTTAGDVLEVVIDDSGNWSVTLLAPIDHTDTTAEDIFTFNVPVSVSDGAATTTIPDGIAITIEDDSPVPVLAADLTASNDAGTYSAPLDADNDVDDNFGGDGGRVIFTQASIDALVAQNLTSGLSQLSYSLSPDQTTLIAVKQGTTTEVFRITLDPDSAQDQYVVQISLPLDATSNIDFNDGTYEFLGGNTPWAGFVPDGQNPFGPGGGAYADDLSQDLLLTPFSPNGSGNAINGNANSAGVTGGGGGQNVGSNEGIRLDFVLDLENDPDKGVGGGADYDGDPVQRDHSFVSHYDVNGAVVRFGDGNTNTLASFKALLVTDAADDGPVADPVLGTGTLATVNRIVIEYDGEKQEILYDPLQTYPITVTVGNPGGLADRSYTVNFIDSGSGRYATVLGVLDTNVSIATFATTEYQALEIQHLSGDDFALTGFGTTTITDDPVSFNVPISIVDNDGDVLASEDLDITLNPPAQFGGNSQGFQAISTTTASLDDSSFAANFSNDNEPGLPVGSQASASFDGHLRSVFRSAEFSTIAAMSGAFFTDVPASASQQFAVFFDNPGGDSFAMPSMGENLVRWDSSEVSHGPSGLADFGEILVADIRAHMSRGSVGETDFALEGGLQQLGAALPDQFAIASDQDFNVDSRSAFEFASGNGTGTDLAMEALLMLQSSADVATKALPGAIDAATDVLAAIASEAQLERFLEAYADSPQLDVRPGAGFEGSAAGLLDQPLDADRMHPMLVQVDIDQLEASVLAAGHS